MAEPTWLAQQKKAFTGFVNATVKPRNKFVEDFGPDLCDGIILHALLEELSKKKVKGVTPKVSLRLQKISNVTSCLMFAKSEGIKLIGVGGEDFADQNIKLMLGTIWTLILRYQIQKVNFGEDEIEEKEQKPAVAAKTAKDDLLEWVNSVLKPFDVEVSNLNSSWKNGKAFVFLAKAFGGQVTAYDDSDPTKMLEMAFTVSERDLNVPQLLDPYEIAVKKPDEKALMTYLSLFRDNASKAHTQSSKEIAPEPEKKSETKAEKKVEKLPEKIQFSQKRSFTELQFVDPLDRSIEVTPSTVDIVQETEKQNLDLSETTLSGNYRRSFPDTEGEILVQLLDDQGVGMRGGGEAVSGTLKNLRCIDLDGQNDFSAGSEMDLEVTDNNNGTYELAYPGLAIGEYEVRIFVNGEAIPDSPCELRVQDPQKPAFFCKVHDVMKTSEKTENSLEFSCVQCREEAAKREAEISLKKSAKVEKKRKTLVRRKSKHRHKSSGRRRKSSAAPPME